MNKNTLSRRGFIQRAASPLVAAGLGRLTAAQAQSAKPNIVFIMADDLGYADLSSYGRRDYTTPNIDRLAVEGLRLVQAYANSAVCSATRVGLITGRYQYRLPLGLEEPLNAASPKNVGLPPEHPTLPSLLKQIGTERPWSGNGISASCRTSARSRAAMTSSLESGADLRTISITVPAPPIPCTSRKSRSNGTVT